MTKETDIVALFSGEHKLTPREIAEELHLEVSYIKEILRAEFPDDPSLDDGVVNERSVSGQGDASVGPIYDGRVIIDDDVHKEIVDEWINIALHSDDSRTRLAAIRSLHEEKTGRATQAHVAMLRRASRGSGPGAGQVNIFNLQQAREQAEKIVSSAKEGNVVVPVETETIEA